MAPCSSSLVPSRHPPAASRLVVGLVGSAAIGVIAGRRGSLTRGGVAGAMLTGTTVFVAGGALPSALLLTFFGSSSALSHWRRERQEGYPPEVGSASGFAKGERRDLWQVLANGGAASALVLLARVRGDWPWLPGLIGALATVNADTWATEIGMLSRRPPRLVTTGRVVRPGTSGGVTPLGTGAALLGAALIGTVAALGLRGGGRGHHDISPTLALPLAVGAGLAGAFADSLLGATVQARFHCPVCRAPTELARHRCGTVTTLVGGWRPVDNDVVNFVSSLCGAAVGWLWGAGDSRMARFSERRSGQRLRSSAHAQ